MEKIISSNDLGVSPGFISGTAIVRDKDGNIKGEIHFSGPATPAQSAERGLIPQPQDSSET